ncbi:hypothetical protein M2G93_19295 [Vibrio vulnificus]|uniref:hypothetical protein n=1 Tax=Vibrio vulnificus TaxID=672 RepID=UPI0021DA3DD2|nr:hypothetical protein [Vibrio vulnificus]EKZ9225728.1 hypothetical protein [Vibrio vulnificus]MCU8150270.1 hypothetical protein [Vibrio vulnificus]MCU8386946.1 hypothetical protein [Vibrio vulnificus]
MSSQSFIPVCQLKVSPNLLIQFDPANAYATRYTKENLLAAAGLIPSFISNGKESLYKQITSGYGWPVSEMQGSSTEGVYTYDGDEPLSAYVRIAKINVLGMMIAPLLPPNELINMYAEETVEIFPCGICVFTDNGTQRVHRLD